MFSKQLSSNSLKVVLFSDNLCVAPLNDEGSTSCFMQKFGRNLNRGIVEVHLGGGKVMNFKFCPATHNIFGLKRFMQKYKILCYHMFVFTYIGSCKFELEVYDSQCGTHLCDDDDYLCLDEFVPPEPGSQAIFLSSVSGTLIEDADNETLGFHSSSDNAQIEAEGTVLHILLICMNENM
ncbi:uncharacterized protein LOC141687412 isoform X2 [Apium graveolens]|uniref:uncharacterized protein LOC141687412 isoform X2 n=1 Tax=Apium graveolens TaxID=4045 RepID=UPI003D79805E